MNVSLENYIDSVLLLKLMIKLSDKKYFDNIKHHEKLILDTDNKDVYIECTTSSIVDLMLFRIYFDSDKTSNINFILDMTRSLILNSKWDISFSELDIDLDKQYTDVTQFVLENTKLPQFILEIPHKKIYISLLEDLVKKYDDQ